MPITPEQRAERVVSATGSRTRQFHQIANAIPVGLAQACLREVAVPAPVACAAA